MLKFDFDAANRGEPVQYKIAAVDDITFNHRPVFGPRPLEHDEAFVVTRAKRRPVVILSSATVHPTIAGLPRQDFAEVYLVTPLYSFRDNHPLEFRLRIAAWEYSMWFHLPGSEGFEVREGSYASTAALSSPEGSYDRDLLPLRRMRCLRCTTAFGGFSLVSCMRRSRTIAAISWRRWKKP